MAFGAGLCKVGVAPGQETFLGIYGPNCVEVYCNLIGRCIPIDIIIVLQWVVMEQSCSAYSRVVVPLYDTLGREAVIHIANQGMVINSY